LFQVALKVLKEKEFFVQVKSGYVCVLEKKKRIVSLIVFSKEVVFSKICILSTLLVKNFIEKAKVV
jgi:hypothetical protein